MAVNLNSYVWPSMGIEPPTPEDAIYAAGEQPIAGFDNHIMWAVTDDLKRLRDWAADHGNAHEAGGSQEINLNGLSIANVATLNGSDTDNEVALRDTEGLAVVRYDVANDLVRDFPTFATETVHREGIDLRSDLVRGDGTVIYDHADDYFHRARAADEAAWAAEADNSQTLQQHTPGDFLRPGVDATVTANYAFERVVGADIDGNAATANHADEADHATEADHAAMADNSTLHDGYTVQEILDMVEGDLIPGVAVDVADDGAEQLTDAGLLNFGQSIDVSVSGDTATMDVESVPHADRAEYSYNSDKVDGWHIQEIFDEVENLFADKPVDIADDGTTVVGDAERVSFDQSIDVSQKASGVAGVSVTSVPHAQEAEYAVNSDKVDNYHAHELISEAQAGMDDGRWTFIDAWEYGTGSNWNFSTTLASTYDQYRLVAINDPGDHKHNQLVLRLNGDDRHRYWYMRETRDFKDWDIYEEKTTYFPLCHTSDNFTSYGEYIITLPPQPGGSTTAQPQIATTSYAGNPWAGNHKLRYGYLETQSSSVDTFEIQPHQTSAAYIALYGANFPAP